MAFVSSSFFLSFLCENNLSSDSSPSSSPSSCPRQTPTGAFFLSPFLSAPSVIVKTLGRSSGPPEAKRVFFFCTTSTSSPTASPRSRAAASCYFLSVRSAHWFYFDLSGRHIELQYGRSAAQQFNRSEWQLPLEPTGSSTRFHQVPPHWLFVAITRCLNMLMIRKPIIR